MNDETNAANAGIRVDKWLWYARFFKSRSLAAKLVQSRKLRINSVVSSKVSAAVKANDVLTF
ncbi:MAG: S4 domain-containing protein, partial [Sneathiella sp.]